MSARRAAQEIRAGSHEEFITEHYWGYTRLVAVARIPSRASVLEDLER